MDQIQPDPVSVTDTTPPSGGASTARKIGGGFVGGIMATLATLALVNGGSIIGGAQDITAADSIAVIAVARSVDVQVSPDALDTTQLDTFSIDTVVHDPIINRDVLAQSVPNGQAFFVTAGIQGTDGHRTETYSKVYPVTTCPTDADGVEWQKTVSAQLTFSDNPPPKVKP